MRSNFDSPLHRTAHADYPTIYMSMVGVAEEQFLVTTTQQIYITSHHTPYVHLHVPYFHFSLFAFP